MKKIILIFGLILFTFGNKIDNLPTKTKGIIGENILIKGLEKTGWKCVNGEWNNVNGIDALCFKKDKYGKIKDVLIGESKYNKSDLNCGLNNGKMCQMSKEWILDRLKKLSQQCINKPNLRCPTKEELNQILKHVKNNNYRGRLFKISPITEGLKVEIFKVPSGINSEKIKNIKNNFPKIHNTIFAKQGHVININKPKTEIDKDVKNALRQEIQNIKFKSKTNNRLNSLNGKEIKLNSKSIPKSNNLAKKVPIAVKFLGAAKGFLAGVSKYIPYVGAAAQIAWDTYIGYKLDELDEKVSQNTQAIQINTQNIQKNRNLINQNKAYIERILSEQKILKESVANNTYRINQLYAYTFSINKNVENLTSQLKYIQTKVEDLEVSINQNRFEIAKIKKGIFTTGLDMWNIYLKTGDETYLANAIDDFTKSSKIDDNPYFYFYLTLAYTKKYNLHKREKEKILAIENFKKFANLSDDIKYILAASLVLTSIDNNMNETIRNIIKQKIVVKVQTAIKDGNYDMAVDIAGGYFALTKDKSVYDFALTKRKENYLKYKNFKNKENVYNILNKYRNAMLNKAAVRYLYANNYYNDALNILKNKRIEDDNFRLKAYLAIFKVLGEKEKLFQLKQLILSNPTYDKKLKDFTKDI